MERFGQAPLHVPGVGQTEQNHNFCCAIPKNIRILCRLPSNSYLMPLFHRTARAVSHLGSVSAFIGG